MGLLRDDEPIVETAEQSYVKYLNLDIVEALVSRLHKELPRDLVYHYVQHSLHVLYWSMVLAARAGLPDRKRELLALIAIGHDTGYIVQPKHNEPIGGGFTIEAMVSTGRYSAEDYVVVGDGISDTTMVESEGTYVQRPTSELGKFICDADLFSFGQPDMLAYSVALMVEYDIPIKEYKSFLQKTLLMMEAHKWQTEEARELFSSNKTINVIALRSALNTWI